MSLQVDQLLHSLRQNGTIDSEGEFTLSLAKARAKMAAFQSSDPARYLVSILSGGVGGGAVRLSANDGGARLSVWMEGAYFQETQLLAAMESSAHTEVDGSLDLVLGCRGALRNQAESVEIVVEGAGRPCYRWLLQRNAEESSLLPNSLNNGVRVEILFQESMVEKVGRWVRTLRGYVGQRAEFRLVERLMDRSPIPVLLNDETIERPYYLPPSPLELEVGSGATVEFCQTPMAFEDVFGWSGGLACRAGRISIVVRGVVCGTVESDDFSGVIVHDTMSLDLSREKIRDGPSAIRLLEQLEGLRLQMLQRLALTLPSCSKTELPWFFNDLFPVALEHEVSAEVRTAMVAWMGQSESEEATTDKLLEAGLSLLLSDRCPEFELEERWLLERCSAEFRSSEPTLRWIPMSLEFYRKAHPTETLVQGYLLLGMGAVHEQQGRPEQAQECWLSALDTVRAGTDDRAEELIHAHMDFEVEHIIAETGKALALQAR